MGPSMLKAVTKTATHPQATPLGFDGFTAQLKSQFNWLPDTRTGNNTSYTIADAALSAFSVFFTQSPSFLAYQRQMQDNKGKNNADSLFQVTHIPSDNQTRNLLDPIDPVHFAQAFALSFDYLSQTGYLESYRTLNDTLLIAVDAVCYHSSNQIYCNKCSQRKHKDGHISYSHRAITPVIVAPGNRHVISMMPEFITPQDGATKQDSELKATTRWLKRNATLLASEDVTCLGDDLYAHQPFCQSLLAAGCHFLLVCKPSSHKGLYEALEDRECAAETQEGGL